MEETAGRSSRCRQHSRRRKAAILSYTVLSPSAEAPPSTLSDAVLRVLHTDGNLHERLSDLAAILERDGPLFSDGIARSRKHRKGSLFHVSPTDIRSRRDPPTDTDATPEAEQSHDARDGQRDAASLNAIARLRCQRPHELPAEAIQCLRQPTAFVLRDHGLWPAAEAHWGSRTFLEAELSAVSCAVLSAPLSQKEFCYWHAPRRHASLEEALRKGSDRVLGQYQFDEPSVSQLNLCAREFFALADGSDANGRGQCFYLQHAVVKPVLKAGGGGGAAALGVGGDAAAAAAATMRPTTGLGSRMVDDIESSLNRDLLEAMRCAGRLGPWTLTVVFVGVAAQVAGARTRLHYDQVDNLYLQLAGVKTFRLFAPADGGDLYPYPWHHPMDRSAQVDLREGMGEAARSAQLKRFPRFAEAQPIEVTLRPGDLLFLPAYWWHEVVTDAPAAKHAPDELVVSVNFWFSTLPTLTRPPSVPIELSMLHVELGQQIQMVVGDALGDRIDLVPSFVRSLRLQLEAVTEAARVAAAGASSLGGGGGARQGEGRWVRLHKGRPADVDAAAWEALFLYIVAMLCLWLPSPADLLPFLRRHCDESRFARLVLRRP